MPNKSATALLRNNQRLCHIFLTGQPSVGKTTLIKAIIDSCISKTNHGGTESRHKDGDELTCKTNVKLSGLYTEESRGSDGKRDGFDLICFSEKKTNGRSKGSVSSVTRTSLSRAQPKVTKGKPFVGKYLVDVDNIDQFGAASLRQVSDNLQQQSEEEESRTICILDEVGKMELLCPSFLPAVHGVLDTISECNKRGTKEKNTCLLLGTIPTPRYGHVISAVEDIRSRKDVLVLYVTKSNRDELKTKLVSLIEKWIDGGEERSESAFDCRNDLEQYIYQRPIGSGTMDPKNGKQGKGSKAKAAISTKDTNDCDSELIACGPLVHADIDPKVLLLGHTASPKPKDASLAYCERSMWKVLSRIHDLPYEPVQNAESVTKVQADGYKLLVSKVLESGTCIWDVLANVHVKGKPKQQRGKRKSRSSSNAIPNDLPLFLKKHKSIQTVSFIGAKAQGEFVKQFGKDTLGQYHAVILPSSSPANSRLTLDEKAKQWKDVCQG